MKKPELLSPAGDIKKSIFPLIYGADSIYIGSKDFSLRYNKNFSGYEELKKISKLVKENDKKIYLTTNIFMHNNDIESFIENFDEIGKIEPNAYIISDPGILYFLNKNKIENNKKDHIKEKYKIHLSTQANTLNYKAIEFWKENGISRFILARELTLKEIKEIKDYILNNNLNVEIETFIHGAMCISYSGRCLLSLYMTSPHLSKTSGIPYRDANRGMCVHPCRWEFKVVEKKRDNELFDIIEDNNYTYFMSSKDLCLLNFIPLLIISGIDSFKIEGRMKSELYQGITSYVYRKAIDLSYEILKDLNQNDLNYYFNNFDKFINDFKIWEDFTKKNEFYLNLFSHREYTTGFYFIDNPINESVSPAYFRSYERDLKYCGYSILNDQIINKENYEKEIDYNKNFFLNKETFKEIFNIDVDFSIENINKIKINCQKIKNLKFLNNKYYISLIYTKNPLILNKEYLLISKDFEPKKIIIEMAYDFNLDNVNILKSSNYYFIVTEEFIPYFSFILEKND
jgi:putative protease